MVIILDNSMVLPLFFPDEDSTAAERLLERASRETELLVPRLWVSEFGNGLLVATRRGRLSEEKTLVAHRIALRLPLRIADFPELADLSHLHRLSEKHGLSFYDASYLALAINRGGTLATNDGDLRRAAGAEGILHVEGGGKDGGA